VDWLRWSEQYTKTDMVYLARGSFWTGFGKGTQIVTGTACAVAFANFLPKEVYGNYKYILAAAGFFGAFTLNGLKPAITQAVARGYDGSLKQGLQSMIKWSGIITILASGVSAYYFLQGNALLGSGMLLVAIFQPIIKTTYLYDAQLFGKKLFKVQGIYLTIQEIAQTAALIGALFFTQNAAVLVAILFVINTVFKSTYLHRTLTYHASSNDKTDPETQNYGKHLSLMHVINSTAKHLDKILVFQLLGAGPTAIYTFALLPTKKLRKFAKALNNIVLPKLSQKPLETLQATLARKALIAFIFSGLVTIAVILLLPVVFNLLLPAYTNAIIYAQWAAVTILFVPEMLFSQALTAHIKKRELYIVNITSNVLKIILLLSFIPLLGLWGGIYAFALTLFIRLTMKIFFFYHVSPEH